MKNRDFNIARSETWLDDNLDIIAKVLSDTIKDFVEPNDRIINIEVKERNGLSRFWIYTETIKRGRK